MIDAQNKLYTEKDHRRGFTLIELMVVVAIISLLSSVVLASLSSAREKADIAKATADVKTLHDVLLEYYLENNSWPGLPNPGNVNTFEQWNDPSLKPYLPNTPIDPWGHPYFFDGHPTVECNVGQSAVCSGGPDKTLNVHPDGSLNSPTATVFGDDVCVYFTPTC